MRDVNERQMDTRRVYRHVQTNVEARAETRQEQEDRSEHSRAGEDRLQQLRAHMGRQLSGSPALETIASEDILLRGVSLIRRNGKRFPSRGVSYLFTGTVFQASSPQKT